MTMHALVYLGPGKLAWEERPVPVLIDSADAIVRITATTICGTDLHILRGDVPTVEPGRILGHEGVGVVESVGADVHGVAPGDRVVISLISACGRCDRCRVGMHAHCRSGGWQLGHTIDGCQAEYVRVPFADNGLHKLPDTVDDAAAVMLSCILPTGLECGVHAGRVKPGDRVAIVGAGPVGLATMLTVRLYSPASVVLLDVDPARLETARALGADHTINTGEGDPVAAVKAWTDEAGVDVAIEAVGRPETFAVCEAILAPGGHLANVGVHAAPVELHLERLWDADVTLTTRLVDGGSTPMLLWMVAAGRIAPKALVSHQLPMSEILRAYDMFEHAAEHGALKVVLSADVPAVSDR